MSTTTSDNHKTWLAKIYDKTGAASWDNLRSKGIYGIKIGDLITPPLPDEEEDAFIKRMNEVVRKNNPENERTIFGRQVWNMCNGIKVGDRIVAVHKTNVIAKGTVRSACTSGPDPDGSSNFFYQMQVDWTERFAKVAGLDGEFTGYKTTSFMCISDDVNLLSALGESEQDKAPLQIQEQGTLAPLVNFASPLNRILSGPPGTGKTYNTINKSVTLCRKTDGAWVAPGLKGKEERQKWINQYQELIKEGRIEFITFHQSYDYSDFVQGIRPREQSGAMSFEFFKGPLRRIADAAAASYRSGSGPVPYVLIIDEINRGNVSKIFGELITLIEEDKRGVSGHAVGMSARLLYEKSDAPRFYLPPNLYIIGTLNTADRSVQRLDSAMRRRFDFEDIMPQPEVLGGRLEAFLSELNARLLKALSDPGSLVGHAWFMDSEGNPISNDEELARVLNNKVIPLLGEWFWDQPESLKLVLGEGALKLVREKGGLLQRRMAGGEVELFLKSFASKGS
jgi:5-methylcytosine-specific restriction protein B